MKLRGEMFSYPMPYNEINIVKNVMQIHSHDGIGKGFCYAYRLKGDNEDTKFVLCEKDFKIISRFEEMDVKVKDNVIHIKTDKVKMKLASLVDYPTYTPDFTAMWPLKVNYADIYRARNFTCNDDVRIQGHGVTVHKDAIIATDGAKVFEISGIDTEAPFEAINIPKETFKYVPAMDGIKIEANEKGAKFIFPNYAGFYYTNLIAQVVPKGIQNKFANVPITIEFKVVKNELISHLKQIKEIDAEGKVDFVFNGKEEKIILRGEREEGDIEIELNAQNVQIKEDITVVMDISYLMIVLNAALKDEIMMRTGTKTFMTVEDDAFIALLPTVRTIK